MISLDQIPRLQNYLLGLEQFFRDLEAEWRTIARAAHDRGYTNGHAQGHAMGFQAGKQEGQEEGYHEGLRDGMRAAGKELMEDGDAAE